MHILYDVHTKQENAEIEKVKKGTTLINLHTKKMYID